MILDMKKIFSNIVRKALSPKKKINKLDFIKTKNFC